MLLSVAPDATVEVGVSLFGKALLGRVELEGPQEVVGLLEVRADGDDLVDEVLNSGDAGVLELLFDDDVVGKRDSLAVELAETALVDELADGGDGRVAVSDVRLDSSEHVDGGLVELDEDAVVELSQSQELHDLSALGVQLVDTTNNQILLSNNKRTAAN